MEKFYKEIFHIILLFPIWEQEKSEMNMIRLYNKIVKKILINIFF